MTRDVSEIRVGLVGYGTIGRRLAAAVPDLPGIHLTAVATRRPQPGLARLAAGGTRVHHAQHGSDRGAVAAMLGEVDVVLDCTPRGVGGTLEPLYRAAGVRVIYQGGEADGLAEAEYCCGIGFDAARRARSVRIPSCNTTALVRLATALGGSEEIARFRAVITRSATDPDKAFKGVVNDLTAGAGLSHHGQDVRHFLPQLDIVTLAASASVNCGHLAALFVEMRGDVSADEVHDRLARSPRTILPSGGSGTLHDLRRAIPTSPRGDCPSVLVWREAVSVRDREVALFAGIHMESIVVPETLDALQAVAGTPLDAAGAMAASDAVHGLAPAPVPHESAVA